MGELPGHGKLQAVIRGTGGVFPNPQRPKIGVQVSSIRVKRQPIDCLCAIDLATKFAAEGVGDTGTFREPPPWNAIHIFRTKELAAGRAYVIYFQGEIRKNLSL